MSPGGTDLLNSDSKTIIAIHFKLRGAFFLILSTFLGREGTYLDNNMAKGDLTREFTILTFVFSTW